MDYPLVSCLMPTRNRGKFLPRSIAMFEAQKWPNKELWILEDGDEYNYGLSWRPSVYYIRFEGTIGAKLNYAASLANGSILVRWDDDDWNGPTRISDQVAHMRLSGKPFVGMSSLIYYAEGDSKGYEYTGDAWYASGSTHCYTREWALAHPHPDLSLAEDDGAVKEAHRARALSTVSGLRCLVACDHEANTSARMFGKIAPELFTLFRETADNWKPIPLSEFESTIGKYNAVAAAAV